MWYVRDRWVPAVVLSGTIKRPRGNLAVLRWEGVHPACTAHAAASSRWSDVVIARSQHRCHWHCHQLHRLAHQWRSYWETPRSGFISAVWIVVICFELSVPVQGIAWKDSSPKWPITCRAGHILCVERDVKLLTHADRIRYLVTVRFDSKPIQLLQNFEYLFKCYIHKDGQWHSRGYRLPGQTAILPPPKSWSV